MKFSFFSLLALIFFTGASALKAQTWHTDFKEAKALAQQEKKPILLVFQGSDWCAPCIRLEREIWDSEPFKKYAKDHYILVKADFPRKKKNQLPEALEIQNKQLAEQYNTEGYFPLAVMLNEQGKLLGKSGYEPITPEKYLDRLNAFLANK